MLNAELNIYHSESRSLRRNMINKKKHVSIKKPDIFQNAKRRTGQLTTLDPMSLDLMLCMLLYCPFTHSLCRDPLSTCPMFEHSSQKDGKLDLLLALYPLIFWIMGSSRRRVECQHTELHEGKGASGSKRCLSGRLQGQISMAGSLPGL